MSVMLCLSAQPLFSGSKSNFLSRKKDLASTERVRGAILSERQLLVSVSPLPRATAYPAVLLSPLYINAVLFSFWLKL